MFTYSVGECMGSLRFAFSVALVGLYDGSALSALQYRFASVGWPEWAGVLFGHSVILFCCICQIVEMIG